jgi:hypothetical protein
VLIDCADLSFEVVHSVTSSDDATASPLTFDSFTSDSQAIGVVPSARLTPRGATDTVSIQLVFTGHGKKQTSDPFVFSKPADPTSDVISQGGDEKTSLPWWVFVVVGGLALLAGTLLVLFLFSFFRRRKPSELLVALQKEKEELLGDKSPLRSSTNSSTWVRPDSPVPDLQPPSVDSPEPVVPKTQEAPPLAEGVNTFMMPQSGEDRTPSQQPGAHTDSKEDANVISVMFCEPPFAAATIGKGESLFDYLHNGRKLPRAGRPHEVLFPTDKMRAEFLYHIVGAIQHVFTTNRAAPGLKDLSPFHIFPRPGRPPALAVEANLDMPSEDLMRWKAPELMSGDKPQVTEATLVYAVGMLLWEILTGLMPLASYEGAALLEVASSADNWLRVTSDTPLWRVVQCCLLREPADRVTLRDLSGRLCVLARESSIESVTREPTPPPERPLFVDVAAEGIDPDADDDPKKAQRYGKDDHLPAPAVAGAQDAGPQAAAAAADGTQTGQTSKQARKKNTETKGAKDGQASNSSSTARGGEQPGPVTTATGTNLGN